MVLCVYKKCILCVKCIFRGFDYHERPTLLIKELRYRVSIIKLVFSIVDVWNFRIKKGNFNALSIG